MKIVFKYIGVFLLVITNHTINAQNLELDSLYIKEKKRLGKLAYKHYNKDYDKAISLLHDQKKYMQHHHDTVGLIQWDNEMLWLFTARMGNVDSASVYLERVKKNLPKIKSQVTLGASYTRIGFAYQLKGYYRLAMENYLQSVDIKEKIGHQGSLGFSYNLIGKLYELQEQYENSIKFHRRAINSRKTLKNKLHLAHSYTNLGITFRKANKLDSAFFHMQKAIELRRQKSDTLKGRQYANVLKCRGDIYVARKEYKKAISDFERAITIIDRTKGKYIKIQSLNSLAACYLALGQFSKANNAIKKSSSILAEYPIKDLQVINYEMQSEYYFKNENYKKAYAINKLRDSLNNEIRNEKILMNTEELQILYSAEKRDKIIARLDLEKNAVENEKKLLLVEKEKDKTEKSLLIGVILLALTIIGGLSFFFFNKRKHAKILQKKNAIIYSSLAEKETLLKEMNHRVKNCFQLVSSLLYLQSQNMNDKVAEDAMKIAQDRVKSMALLHQKLYQNKTLVGINTREYIIDLIESIFQSNKIQDDIELSFDIDDLVLKIDTMTSLGLIVNELITNIIKHAFNASSKDKKIKVSLKRDEEYLKLIVKDNGIGIQQQETNTFGIKLINSLSRKLKANVQFTNNEGTEVLVLIKKFTEI